MLTRKDINEFKSIGYYAVSAIIANRPNPDGWIIVSAIILAIVGLFCAFRKD